MEAAFTGDHGIHITSGYQVLGFYVGFWLSFGRTLIARKPGETYSGWQSANLKHAAPSHLPPKLQTMSWLHHHLKSSLTVLFGAGEITASLRQNRTEDIRQLMLAEIGHLGDARCPRVTRRIRYATDAHGLWYARGDLMEILAAAHGETAAREKIKRISAEFKGLLPSGMNTRSSSLTF